MINKIKDFLKNRFRRKSTDDFSDQSESETSETDEPSELSAPTDDENFGPSEPNFGPAEPNFGPPEPNFDLSKPDFDPTALSPEVGVEQERQTGPMRNLLTEEEPATEVELMEEPSEQETVEAPVTDEKTNIIPNFTSSYNRSMLDTEDPYDGTADRKLSGKEKALAFFSRMKFKLGQVKLKKPDLSGIKMPDFSKIGKDGGPVLSPSLSKNIDKFLSRESRETIHQVSLVLLISMFTYTLGKISALVVRGAPTLETAKNFSVEIPVDQDFNPLSLNQVKSINIFRTGSGTKGPTKIADTKCEEAQQASSLPIKLINTVVLQDSVKSLASVQVRGGRDLQEVREGEQIDGLAKIFKITRLEILVKNLENGACESIASDVAEESNSPISVMSPSESRAFKATKKMSGIENMGNKYVISKALLDEKMKDIGAILTQARAIKIQNPDGSLAFKLTEMDPNGIFTYLGLQDQDIITSIDGKPIYDMNEVMTKFARIKNLDKLQLGIRREGSDSIQDYSIKK